jgi:SAM-dependent methyltransferase
MPYADHIRALFPSLELNVTDLFALEGHQIAGLPSRAPGKELAEVLHAHPELRAFLEVRCPPIAGYLSRLLDEHGPADPAALSTSEQTLLWELGELLVYDTRPDLYDALATNDWDFGVVADMVELDGMTVIDAGAGSGKLAFGAAGQAEHVFAVEPVARLREFMREKATSSGITNLFVLDGTLDAIPLPPDSADVLLTCRAIGWRLEEELVEIERVVKAGGVALHLGLPHPASPDDDLHRRLNDAGYLATTYLEGDEQRCSYRKRLPG